MISKVIDIGLCMFILKQNPNKNIFSSLVSKDSQKEFYNPFLSRTIEFIQIIILNITLARRLS